MSIKTMIQDVCIGTKYWGIALYGKTGVHRPKILKLLGEATHNDLMRDGFTLRISPSKINVKKLFRQFSEEDDLTIQITSPSGKVWIYYD